MLEFVFLNGRRKLPSRKMEPIDVITLHPPQPSNVWKHLVHLILVNNVVFKFMFDLEFMYDKMHQFGRYISMSF